MPVIGHADRALHPRRATPIGGATLSRFFAIHVFFIPAMSSASSACTWCWCCATASPSHPGRRRGRSRRPTGRSTTRCSSAKACRSGPTRPGATWSSARRWWRRSCMLALIVGPPRPRRAARSEHPRGLSAARLVLPLVLRGARARAQQSRVAHHRGGPAACSARRCCCAPSSTRGRGSVRRRPWAPLLVVFIWVTIVSFWMAGERADWSPDFDPAAARRRSCASERPEVVEGARLFRAKGCEFCHAVEGFGGRRGPDLSDVRGRMSRIRSRPGSPTASDNMPAYARTLTPPRCRR